MVPFVAFGFVDNTVLIYAGDAIDRSVGVAFGLSSLAAAAMGQIFSDTSGVLFGSTIEDAALRLGLTMPQLTETQQLARATRFASTAGKVFGVVLGCSLGLVNLLFIDTLAAEKAKEEKEYTAIFRAIMHKGHEVAECAAAALWIVDRENRELWTRAAHGNKMSDLTVRRPFGVGIVGSVAETGELSNVVDAYSHPRFDRTVDRDGITGFKSDTLLTCPVKNDEGEIVAVVQLVNKHEKKRTKAKEERSGTTTASRDEGVPDAGRGEGEKRRRSFFGRGDFFGGGGRVPARKGVDAIRRERREAHPAHRAPRLREPRGDGTQTPDRGVRRERSGAERRRDGPSETRRGSRGFSFFGTSSFLEHFLPCCVYESAHPTRARLSSVSIRPPCHSSVSPRVVRTPRALLPSSSPLPPRACFDHSSLGVLGNPRPGNLAFLSPALHLLTPSTPAILSAPMRLHGTMRPPSPRRIVSTLRMRVPWR